MKAIEKTFKEHPKLDGIKIHPAGHGLEINEKNCGKIFDFAKERSLYIITHTQPTPGANSIAFRPVMKKRKDARFILGHASPIEESVFMALSFENCYVEPCWLAHFSLMFEMMGRLFQYKKMLVGTDGPMRFPTWKIDDVRMDVIEEEISYTRKLMPTMKEVQMYC
jgi:predicted TIM-barrel fold metal-dependent hydrolase